MDAEPGLQSDAVLVRRGWLKIGVGLAVAAQAMVFSLAVSLAPAQGVERWLIHGGLMASSVGVLVFLGRDLLAEAWSSLRARRLTIDLLFLLTLLGALGGSLLGTFTGRGAVYYEVVAVILVVYTAGKLVGARSRVAALRAADGVAARLDVCSVLGADGRVERRPVADLRGGERVVIAPGEAICVDGVVREGRAYVEQAAMTGEWRPEPCGPGDAVWAGCHAIDGRLVVEAASPPRRIDAILAALTEARLAPSAWQDQADRLLRVWLPVVGGTATATFFGWWLFGQVSWDRALFNAMAVLLVACPCAFGLATPVAVWGGLARLARLGIVARSGDFLDALSRVDLVALDKTGTLSEDRPEVLGWRFAPGWESRAYELRVAVAALEAGQAHPIARALVEDVGKVSISPVEVRSLRVEPGRGIEGEVTGLGWVRVGEQEFCGAALGGWVAEPGVSASLKRIHVAVNGRTIAVVELAERWREGAVEVCSRLRELGVVVEILSGDPSAAEPRGDVTIPVFAGLSPKEKTDRVRWHEAKGRRVLLVGDGINDAAAMSVATGSLALVSGGELARAAAQAVTEGDNLRRLPEVILIARRVRAALRVNLRFSIAYNALGMALAAAGLLHPVVAALLMVGSSAWVGARAMRSSEC